MSHENEPPPRACRLGEGAGASAGTVAARILPRAAIRALAESYLEDEDPGLRLSALQALHALDRREREAR